MKLVSEYENSAQKVASYKNYLRFNLHCRHSVVVMASLCLRSVIQGRIADTIIGGGKNWSYSGKSEKFGGNRVSETESVSSIA